jgi:hypothetical protein
MAITIEADKKLSRLDEKRTYSKRPNEKSQKGPNRLLTADGFDLTSFYLSFFPNFSILQTHIHP